MKENLQAFLPVSAGLGLAVDCLDLLSMQPRPAASDAHSLSAYVPVIGGYAMTATLRQPESSYGAWGYAYRWPLR